MIKIYHNPRCSKSRETLKILEEQAKEVKVIEYLKTPPSVGEIRDILSKLKLSPLELIRKNETIFKEQFKGKELNDEQWIEAMAENPKLIERPIVVKDDQAVIGRPPENVNQLF